MDFLPAVETVIREVKGGHVTPWTNQFCPPAVLLYAIYIIVCTLLKYNHPNVNNRCLLRVLNPFFFLRCIIIRKTSNEREFFDDAKLGSVAG